MSNGEEGRFEEENRFLSPYRKGGKMMGEEGKKLAGQAVVSLTLGILGICSWVVPFAGFILGIIAIATGILGEGLIRKSGGTLKGEGFVWTGLILGIVSVVLAVLVLWVSGSMLGFLPQWRLLPH